MEQKKGATEKVREHARDIKKSKKKRVWAQRAWGSHVYDYLDIYYLERGYLCTLH